MVKLSRETEKINDILQQIDELLIKIKGSAIISIPMQAVVSKYHDDGERLKILEFVKTEIEADNIKRQKIAEKWLYGDGREDIQIKREVSYV